MDRKEIREFSFGEFRLDADRRLLFRQGQAVALNSKTFDLLLTLVTSRGQVLTKNELLDRVWENQFVAENNLSVHIAALRKALGETKNDHRFIVTVPGKGYRFVGELNGAADHEMVVERHRFQRIVVEGIQVQVPDQANGGEADETITLTPTPRASRILAPPAARSPRPYLVSLLVLVVALAAMGGVYALSRRWTNRPAASMPFVQHRIRQLTTNGKAGNAALSPDGKLFAYTVDELGQKSLWLGFVDGGNQIRLREPAEATIRSLTFSPDNRDLYFLLRDEKTPQTSLFRIPAKGGVEMKVRAGIDDFALAPDGMRIAYGRTDKIAKQDSLVVGRIDNSEEQVAATFPQDRSFDSGTISWSPDGRHLAVILAEESRGIGNRLAILDAATGNIDKVAHQGFLQITKTAWLREGSGLILTAAELPTSSSVPQYRLFRVAYPGGQTQELTTDRSNYGASWHNDAGVSLSLAEAADLIVTVEHRQLANIWIAPAQDLSRAKQITFSSFGKYDGLWGLDWTPDGSLIYTTSDTQSQFLATVKSDGSGARDLTGPGHFDSVLTISADGRYVLFHSNRGSAIDIWRMDRDGANLKQLTFGGQGYHPAPSPDGRWVYYKSLLDGSGALFRVPMDGGEPERVTEGAAWWTSFSPDGRYFAASYMTDQVRLAIFSAKTNELIKQFELPKNGTLYMGSRWTPDSKAVTFRDKNYGYWIQPIDGGEPRRLEGLPKERLYNFSWSRDGRWIAFVRGPEIRDVVLIENVAQ
jgi:DNA-binding winged helix-turn-helix (wHTH) protein/Tol biopolymer transport system component